MNWPDLIQKKIISQEEATRFSASFRMFGKKVVFTNGCFDILHRGHADYLARARNLGQALFVGLNSDDSVKRLGKGEGRPVQKQEDRAFLLASLICVDYVVIFDEDTPEELIKKIQPDVLVKGGDYTPDQIAGADFVTSYGGRVEIIPLVEGYSTTSIIKKIKNL
jgi:D-beta-D-heptose 7-phosphate kinase/D-beta-D-heptose 1-phosphate adenosyltransferase